MPQHETSPHGRSPLQGHADAPGGVELTVANYVSTVALSWLIPAAGYWVLGQRVRAVILGTLILGAFWTGQAMAEFRAVNRDLHPIFFAGQLGNGFSTLLSEYYVRHAVARSHRDAAGESDSRDDRRVDRKLPEHLGTGINYTTISGLLNLLLLLHLADPRTWREAAGGGEAENDERKRGGGPEASGDGEGEA